MRKTPLLLLVALLMVLAAGCQPGASVTASPGASAATTASAGQQTAAAPEPGAATRPPDATFTLFIPDQNAKVVPDDAPVSKQIYDLTGVRIKRVVPPADPAERLNIMLATDDLTDLILFWDTAIMKQYIAAGKLLGLNDMLAKNCPQLMAVNWVEIQNRIKDEQGTIYYLPGGYHMGGVEGFLPETDNGLNFRTAYFEEAGYDKAPKTFEQYYALLPLIKEKYPEMAPVSLALGAQGHLWGLAGVAAGAYGLEESGGLIRTDDDKLIHHLQSPEVKEFFKFLNKLNTEGYLDIESPVLSAEQLKQKAVAGKVWSFIGPGWEISSEVIAYEMSNNSNEQMVRLYPKASDSINKVTYSRGTMNLYTTGTTITNKCADPDRFLQFFEYTNTEEGRLNAYGIVNWDFTGENTIEATEGYNYIVQRDRTLIPGRPVVVETAWTGEQWAKDENWWWNWGMECFTNFTYYSGNYPGGKYDTVGDSDVSMWWDENTTRINGELGWTGKDYFNKHREMFVDVSEFASLPIDPASDEYASTLAITNIIETKLPRAIMAESAEAFETEWAAMLSEMEKEGLSKYLAKCNELYQERMKQWGKGQ